MSTPKNGKSFSANEVAALVESFKKDISPIAEGVCSLKENANILKNDMTGVKSDLTVIKDVIRTAIPSINKRIETIEVKIGI